MRLIQATWIIPTIGLTLVMPLARAQTLPGPTPRFLQLMEQYLLAHEQDQALPLLGAASRLKEHLFTEASPSQYEASLRHLDQFHPAHREAIFALALSLQQRWEVLYGAAAAQLQNEQMDRVQASEAAGLMIGITALAVSLPRRPDRLPVYFRLLRGILPAVGLASGGAIGGRVGNARAQIPQAPAQLMRLGLPPSTDLDLTQLNRETMRRELAILASSLSVTALSADLMGLILSARSVNAATAPAKLHPGYLLGSVALGLVFEVGLRAYVDHRETTRHERNFVTAARNLEDSLRHRSPVDQHRAALRLALRAREMAALRNRELFLAAQEASEQLTSGKDQSAALDTLMAAADAEARRLGRIDSTDERSSTVLQFLRSGIDPSALALEPVSRSQAEGYVRRFERWVSQRESYERNSWDEDSRSIAWTNYLQGAESTLRDGLASRLREGHVAQHSSVVLLQAVSLLRARGNPALEEIADELESRLQNSQLLLGALTHTPGGRR